MYLKLHLFFLNFQILQSQFFFFYHLLSPYFQEFSESFLKISYRIVCCHFVDDFIKKEVIVIFLKFLLSLFKRLPNLMIGCSVLAFREGEYEFSFIDVSRKLFGFFIIICKVILMFLFFIDFFVLSCDPFVVNNLLYERSVLRIYREHLLNQYFCFWTHFRLINFILKIVPFLYQLSLCELLSLINEGISIVKELV